LPTSSLKHANKIYFILLLAIWYDIIKDEVKAWQSARNNKKRKINWQFTTKDARVKLKKHIRQFMLNLTLV